jgi:O-antigen/teichoic acid export membrane protein
MNWPHVVTLFISVGLQPAFAYAAGAGWMSPERLRRLAFRYTIAVALPSMIVYLFLCPLIFHKQFPNGIYVAAAFAPFIPLGLYTSLIAPIHQGVGDFRTFNINRLFRAATWTIWAVALTAIARLTVLNLLIGQLMILALLGVFLTSRRHQFERAGTLTEKASTSGIFKYGFAIYISYIAYTVNQSLDQLLLSIWVVPSDLGQYVAAASLSGLLLIMPNAVGPIVFSKLARQDDRKSQRQDMRLALRLSIALMLPATLGLFLLAPWITRLLYGAQFAQAGQLLRVLAPAAAFLGIGVSLSEVLRGAGKPIYATYGSLAGAVVTIGGLAWALPRFGIWGAAWVSFVAYGVMMGVQAALLWKWRAAGGELSQTIALPLVDETAVVAPGQSLGS